MSCPRCNTTLQVVERQAIETDYCPGCRVVWLDRGELDRLLERPSGPVRASSAPVRPGPAPRDDWRDADDDDDNRHRSSPAGRESAAYGLRGNPRRKRSWLGELLDVD